MKHRSGSITFFLQQGPGRLIEHIKVKRNQVCVYLSRTVGFLSWMTLRSHRARFLPVTVDDAGQSFKDGVKRGENTKNLIFFILGPWCQCMPLLKNPHFQVREQQEFVSPLKSMTPLELLNFVPDSELWNIPPFVDCSEDYSYSSCKRGWSCISEVHCVSGMTQWPCHHQYK